MQKINVLNKNETVAIVNYCNTPNSRRTGLLDTLALGVYDGILMVIPKYRRKFSGFINSIHMIGMKFPIAVVWTDAEGVVKYKTYAKAGFHFYSPPCGAAYIIEMHPDALNKLEIGDHLCLKTEKGEILHG